MSLLFIAWRNLFNRRVQTLITIGVVAVGIAVTLAILLLSSGIKQGIVRASEPFGMLVGSKGSSSQLVFNTIFLMDNPLANLEPEYYESLADDERVSQAVPFALGDNYEGFRIVGTSVSFFDLKARPVDPAYFRLASGRLFEQPFEAVIGAKVARETGLKPGDTFVSAHGVTESREQEEHTEHPYTVVGVLKGVAAPSDQGIYVNMESYWLGHEHEDEHEGEVSGENGATAGFENSEAEHSAEERGVTAALIKPKSYTDLMTMYQEINRGKDAQAVFPGQTLARIFDMMGSGEQVLRIVGYVVLGMAGLTVILALYGATVERRRTVAILRAIGAGRAEVLAIVLLESALVMLIGCAAGYAAGYGLAYLLTGYLGEFLSISAPIRFQAGQLSLVGYVALAGTAAGLLPALSAYRTETARYLNAS
ncbi:FtsX-like permease family protein [Cohnella fermenti]|uniref:Putative hemin transport system permease protein HrtB n=1 Tax=Cohnella fermenti TaxID=2565925 RepID=A0A4S4C6I3_9BACL|nr:FtsX-like permease family protein [Cohnella fermenti]